MIFQGMGMELKKAALTQRPQRRRGKKRREEGERGGRENVGHHGKTRKDTERHGGGEDEG